MKIFSFIKNIYAKPKIGIPILLALGIFFILSSPKVARAGYNPNNIISDAAFAAYTTMSEQQIQDFLVSRNSYLKNYTEARSNFMGAPERYQAQGKSAAHIIWWVSNEYKINPQAILITLEKEQSLISNPNLNQYGIDFAMGYGCPDSTGCTSNSYPGFSRQVDWGSWQLKYNMVNANGAPYNDTDAGKFGGTDGLIRCIDVSPYCTGRTLNIDGTAITLETGATASLFRYTPHIYWGNYNFYYFYVNWFSPYDYEFVSAVNPPETVGAGQTKSAQVVLKNTGVVPWYNDTQNPLTTPMRLYVYSGAELYSNDGSWESPGRIRMTTAVVNPGQNGTFQFTVKPQMTAPASYSLKFFPIIENTTMLKDVGMTFNVNVPEWHNYHFISSINPPATTTPGQTVDVRIVLSNDGSALWQNDSQNPGNPMRLAVLSGSEFYEPTTWAGSSRIKMTSGAVSYNQYATFSFKMKMPTRSGTYQLRIAPIIESINQYPDQGMVFSTTVFETGITHRFWSPSRGAHFYTNNFNEFFYAYNNPGIYSYEGTSYKISATQLNGYSPIYRFWNQEKLVHFYTISESEKNSVVANMPEWKLEGVAYYALDTSQWFTTPVYRFLNKNTEVHFYTISATEKNYVISNLSNDWEYEGIAWHAPLSS